MPSTFVSSTADDDEYVDEATASVIFHVAVRTMQDWRARGLIPFYRLGSTKGVRYKRSDLDAFAASRRVERS